MIFGIREKIKKKMPAPLIGVYKVARYAVVVAFFYMFRIFPINRRKVVLMNIWGYGDNVRYVAEALVRDDDREMPINNTSLSVVFITNRPSCVEDDGMRALRTNSPAAIFALATAAVWVEVNRKEGYVRKRKGQHYIQTWHGGLPLKKVEGDCEGFLGGKYIRRAKWDSDMTDVYVSNGKFCTDMYRRAFYYKGRILEYGMPRNDGMWNDFCLHNGRHGGSDNEPAHNGPVQPTRHGSGNHHIFKHREETRKLAIYAPTYREMGSTNAYIRDIGRLRQELNEKFGQEFVVVVRMHPLHVDGTEMYAYDEWVINGSGERDLYEMLVGADVLVTDYSNTMFECAMVGKPVFIYASDWDGYADGRGMYFTKEELPFGVAESEEELWENVRDFDYGEYMLRTRAFLQKTGTKETGNASFLVARHIREHCAKDE